MKITPLAVVLLGIGALPAFAQLAQDSFDSSDPFASRFKEKARFELKIKPPKAGGAVKIAADHEDCAQGLDVCTATGDVKLQYQDVEMSAQTLTFDRRSQIATAEGNVVIDQGPTRLSGRRAVFDLEKKTGTIEEAEADLQPTFHVIAKSITKSGEATYDVTDGVFTACSVPDPAWSFAMDRASITLDDYARMHGVTFHARKVPLLYSPYILWPTKEDRASGFLVPGLGYNNERGAFLGLTYYWVTGRPTDATTELDMYSRGAIGLGQEFRWAPSAESAGVFQGFLAHDTAATLCEPGTTTDPTKVCLLPNGSAGVLSTGHATRWKLRLDHSSSDLPGDMRAVVSIRDYSDENFLQDFERSYNLNAARQIQSTAFLTKNFGDDSANLRFERTETFFSSTVLQERVPSLEFAHRTARIGDSPLYAALDASFSELFVNRGQNAAHGSYERGDLHPILSLPIKNIPWLSLTASGGGRITWYSDSVTPLTTEGQEFSGEELTRRYGEAGFSIVGPSFSRIYAFSLGPFAKWKHIIEPRVDYTYVSPVNGLDRVPLFDEIDSVFGQNAVTYKLVNRLLAKGGGEDAPSAQEVATLELSQTYNFQDPQTVAFEGTTVIEPPRRGPFQALLRLAPVPAFHLDAQAAYDASVSRFTSYSFAAGATWKDEYAELSWAANRPIITTPPGPPPPPGTPVADPNSDFIRASAGVYLFSKHWRLDTQLNYDVRQGLMAEDRSLLSYEGSCYRILLEVRNLRSTEPGFPSRHDFRLVFNLKNIGTLLDMNGGLDKIF
ncbi:MAG TPA: LPS assembly protein LptD [Thermoanaerobaculia bacterium]|nr:LPS assembly protein LptD [Thermoanaerobaculia bacterium]